MADASLQPIIIKKVKKGGHGHHGGAWKIAYADFVTAMMAFFLLLWLLNSVTQEQLEGIADYFAPVSVSQTASGAGGILGGKTVTEEGAAQSSTSRDSVTVDLPPPEAGTGGGKDEAEGDTSAEEAEEKRQEIEQEQLEDAKAELEETIASIPNMKELTESLLVDNTPEGLRIQLIDRDGVAMFASGGSKMFLHTRRLLELVAKVIIKMPQQISISGHTDAVPFVTDNGFGNWELSADRANATRRELLHDKVPEARFSRIVGKAATEPLLPEDPKHARNRRISIILLRGTGHDAKPGPAKPEALPGLNQIQERQLNEQNGEAKPHVVKPRPPVTIPKPDIASPDKPEALPGLNQIKERQRQEPVGALQLTPQIEAQ